MDDTRPQPDRIILPDGREVVTKQVIINRPRLRAYYANNRHKVQASVVRTRLRDRLPAGFLDDVDPTDYAAIRGKCKAFQWVERKGKCKLSEASQETLHMCAVDMAKKDKVPPPRDGEDLWQFIVDLCIAWYRKKDAATDN